MTDGLRLDRAATKVMPDDRIVVTWNLEPMFGKGSVEVLQEQVTRHHKTAKTWDGPERSSLKNRTEAFMKYIYSRPAAGWRAKPGGL